jgi:two-component SAPR family response regulator
MRIANIVFKLDYAEIPASGGATMSQGDHSCAFFNDVVEAWQFCADVIAAAERRDFKYSIVCGEIVDAQSKRCADAIPDAAVVSLGDLALDEAPISITKVICRVRQLVEATIAGGSAGLLLLFDMSWLLRLPSGIAQHGEFEAALHQLTLEDMRLRTMCLYHLPKFPEGMVLDAMRTHPRVRTKHGEFENPHCLPPQAFLNGDAEAKLQSWLNTLRPVITRKRPERASRPLPSHTITIPGKESIVPRGYINEQTAWVHPAAAQNWKIRCFGNLRIYREDGSPVRWSTANGATIKTKALFAYLLHRGTSGASAEDLADLLWPQAEGMNQSLNRLYHTIHCLRTALSPNLKHSRASPFVLGHDHYYRLALPEGTWVDVPIFEQFCRRGEKLLKAGQLEDALACYVSAEALYSGSLLSDIPPEYAENTERDWCWSRRYWLEEIYVKMLTQMSSIYRQVENPQRAIAYGEKALKLEPCFERAHQELMRSFSGMGRRDAIERQYRLCVNALRRQEGRAPSADTRILFQTLVS